MLDDAQWRDDGSKLVAEEQNSASASESKRILKLRNVVDRQMGKTE